MSAIIATHGEIDDIHDEYGILWAQHQEALKRIDALEAENKRLTKIRRDLLDLLKMEMK